MRFARVLDERIKMEGNSLSHRASCCRGHDDEEIQEIRFILKRTMYALLCRILLPPLSFFFFLAGGFAHSFAFSRKCFETRRSWHFYPVHLPYEDVSRRNISPMRNLSFRRQRSNEHASELCDAFNFIYIAVKYSFLRRQYTISAVCAISPIHASWNSL